MPKKNQPVAPVTPAKHTGKPLTTPVIDPDDPGVPQESDPDIITDDDEFITPPYEAPEPGEGP